MSTEEDEIRWNLWPRQLQALNSPATELLFGGASEGGKSHFIRVATSAWCMEIAGLQCAIFRKHFDDVTGNHMNGPTGFRTMLQPFIAAGHVTLTQTEVRFANGSLITLNHIADDRDLDKRQGRETHVLVFDEATQIQERFIRFIRGWCRMSKEFKQTLPVEYRDRFPRIIYTANPIGPSVGYFRRHFVKARQEFVIERTSDTEGGFLRQYIPSRVGDNLSADRTALKRRLAGMGDAALAKALEEGDWDAPVGDFFPEWTERNITAPFTPPKYWKRWRGFDWGTTHPFAVGWFCSSDGESFTDRNGKIRWFPRGAVVQYREWVGCDPDRPNVGLGMRNQEIARGILKQSEIECEGCITLTDSLPFQDRGGEYNIAEIFAKEGVMLTQAAMARVQGWSEMRGAIQGVMIDSNDKKRSPLYYVTEDCPYTIDYIPTLARDPKNYQDALKDGEQSHVCEMVRMALFGRLPQSKQEEERFDPNKSWNPALHNIPTFNQALDIIKKNKAKSTGTSW